MFDFVGIFTRIILGMSPAAQPAPTATAPKAVVSSIPLAGAPGTAAATLDANGVVDKVQGFYAGIPQVTALFRQEVFNDVMGTKKKSDGTVRISKPGKMRWDYVEQKNKKTQVEKSFISDGKELYVVEYDNMQVVKKNLEKDLMPVAVSFLYGKGDLKTEFTAALDTTGKYGGKGDYVLKLTPKKPSAQYKNLFLVVSPENFRVTQSVIVDSSNNSNHFRFFSPDFKTKIDDKYFKFDPKSVKNFRVIDADAQQPAPGPAPKK